MNLEDSSYRHGVGHTGEDDVRTLRCACWCFSAATGTA